MPLCIPWSKKISAPPRFLSAPPDCFFIRLAGNGVECNPTCISRGSKTVQQTHEGECQIVL